MYTAHIRVFELTEEFPEPIRGINDFIHLDNITGKTIFTAKERAIDYIRKNLADEPMVIINVMNEFGNCAMSFEVYK